MSLGYYEAFQAHAAARSTKNIAGRAGFYASAAIVHPDKILEGLSRQQRIAVMRDILRHKIHGISFSPYLEGQSPGSHISEEQIEERMKIIQPYTNWVRSFSCRDGHEKIPAIAHKLGLKTLVGISIGDDLEKNEIEMENGIALAKGGHADILAVGNEVMLRGDIPEDEMLDYIRRAKEAVPNVPVGYVDAYFLFEKHPAITEACDVLLINCYPFWESCEARYAPLYMKEMYRRIERIADGKKVIISETGWPSIGSPFGGAVPGEDNAINYFISTYEWAHAEGVEIFYFSSFDESWKVGDEGDVGAYWGLWDQHGQFKYK